MNSKPWPKVVVIGAGAIGGLFGGMLREGGLKVTLIDRWAEHVDAINTRGLRLVGHGGDRDIQIAATTDASEVGPVDVVIVQTKAMHTIEAVKAADALFGPETVAISFQNGLGNEENIGSVIGMDRVLGGLTAQGAMVTGPGVVHNYGDLPSYIGELEGGLSERAERIAAAFTAAGLETHASAELRKVMWKKYLANVALSAASGSTNLNSQQMMAIPELRAVCIGAMEEAALIAAAVGISLSDQEKQEILAPLISLEGTGASKSSLCVDLLNERPTEIDTIAGAVVRLGREHGIATPINQTLVAVIKGKESHYL
ncbi:MAG: 2-dehydropantoate 2-reductase [Alphaproteobacteria bacterium]|nr:2-dehydropantoate 2-reductase [Alphaproteobacteria bacterium]